LPGECQVPSQSVRELSPVSSQVDDSRDIHRKLSSLENSRGNWETENDHVAKKERNLQPTEPLGYHAAQIMQRRDHPGPQRGHPATAIGA
jgi:hypothetical protein